MNNTARIPRTGSVRWRQLVPATLIAAAAALGNVTQSAVAHAEWDIQTYDNYKKVPDSEFPHGPREPQCCKLSCGVMSGMKCDGYPEGPGPAKPVGPTPTVANPPPVTPHHRAAR
jgi:hypothetical protein